MAATIDRTDLTARLAELRASRPALGLRAARGDAGARAELVRVDADIAAATADLEVLALAVEESRRLAAVQDVADAAERRRQLEAEYATQGAARATAYRRIEAALPELAGHARVAEAAAIELDRLGRALGRSPYFPWQFQARQAIARRLAGVVWTDLGWPGLLPAGSAEPLAPDEDGAAS